MKALLVTYPGPSHYYPLAEYGWALRTAGHEVLVATLPAFAEQVTATGLSATPVGPPTDVGAAFRAGFGQLLRMVDRLPRAWPTTLEEAQGRGLVHGMSFGMDHFAQVADLMVDDLLEVAQAWGPDLVAFTPTGYAAPILAARLGVPSVRVLWGPDFFSYSDAIRSATVDGILEAHGAAGVSLLGDTTLDPSPAEVAVPAPERSPRVAFRSVPFNGSGTVTPALLSAGERARVLVTWGTWVRDQQLAHLFRVPDVLEALAARDLDVVLTATESERELLPGIPDNVTVIPPTPLHHVLPGCTGIVHQGGSGTMSAAFGAGVPQLILPQIPDQLFNATRASSTAAASHIHVADVSAERVADGIDHLLSPGTGRAARSIAEELRARPTLPELGALPRATRTRPVPSLERAV